MTTSMIVVTPGMPAMARTRVNGESPAPCASPREDRGSKAVMMNTAPR